MKMEGMIIAALVLGGSIAGAQAQGGSTASTPPAKENAIERGAKAAGADTEKASKGIVKDFEKGVKGIGHDLKKGAGYVGSETKKAAKETEKGMSYVGSETKKGVEKVTPHKKSKPASQSAPQASQ
jgi:hypothetical protein